MPRTEAQKNKDRKQPSRRWAVTDFEVPQDPSTWQDNFPNTLYFATWQVEKCPTTGKEHVQGFLKFEKAVRMAAIKKMFNDGIHCEHSDASDEANIAYCSKEETRIAGPFTFGSNKEERQRSDLKRSLEMLRAGASLFDVADQDLLSYNRYHRGFEKIHALYQAKKHKAWRQLKVTVLWGPTRAGKTSRAMLEDPDAYVQGSLGNNIWFDQYAGEKTIIFDDFYGQIKMSDMLKYLDGHRCMLPVKGGFGHAAWTRVFITSNTHPDNWYINCPPEVRAAFFARIHEIIHVEDPAGGNASAATTTSAPAAPEGRGYNPLTDNTY